MPESAPKKAEFTCAACKKSAAHFSWEKPVYTSGDAIDSEMFTYDGIVFSHRSGPKNRWTDTIIDGKYAKEILALALAKNYKKLNTYLQNIKGFRAGLDSWCDQCDATYCTEHYKRKDEWSDDDTLERVRGTCPIGHERDLFLQD